MKFTILSASERQIYRSIDDQPFITTFTVKTDKGYEATVDIERKGQTKEQLLEAISKELSAIDSLLKTSHST
jgi:hypothetical protein